MAVKDSTRIVCDNCSRSISVENAVRVVSLPPPWRAVAIIGWDGDFHACSDACEAALSTRYERPVDIAAERTPGHEDDTVPSLPVPGRDEP